MKSIFDFVPASIEQLQALPTLHEHNAVRYAKAQLVAAEQQQRESQVKHLAAQAEQAAAEQAAADGHHDPKRLQAAQAGVTAGESDMRIATKRVEAAERAHHAAYETTCMEVERQMIQRHRNMARELDTALEAAGRLSHQMATLEEVSERLFVGGAYRTPRLSVRPLTRLAWWREVGGPGNQQAENRFSYWRTFWRRHYDDAAER